MVEFCLQEKSFGMAAFSIAEIKKPTRRVTYYLSLVNLTMLHALDKGGQNPYPS